VVVVAVVVVVLYCVTAGEFSRSSTRSSSGRPKYRTETALSVSQHPQGVPRDYDSSSSVSIYSGPPSPREHPSTTGELMTVAPGQRQGQSPAYRATGEGYPLAVGTQNGAHGGDRAMMSSMMQKTMTSQARNS